MNCPMLAFVFWHWPRTSVERDEYESWLVAFHQQLSTSLPAGMQRSLTWRVVGAPWLPEESGYEDWYLLDNSTALDVINKDAVSGTLGRYHDAVARLSDGGTSGLYYPAQAVEGDPSSALALWFSKPRGMSYADLYLRIEAQPGRLWRRMLVLGPTPEFCLLQPDAPPIPREFTPISVYREPLWPR
jgi:hypothetical protein